MDPKIQRIQNIWLERLEKAEKKAAKAKPFLTLSPSALEPTNSGYNRDDGKVGAKEISKKSFQLKPEDVKRMVQNRNLHILHALAARGDLDKASIEKILTDKRDFGRSDKFLGEDEKEVGWNRTRRGTAMAEAGGPKNDMYAKLMNQLVENHGVDNNKLNEQLMRKGNNDVASWVAERMDPQHLSRLLGDREKPVKPGAYHGAMNNRGYNTEIGNHILKHGSPAAIEALVFQKPLEPEQYQHLIRNPNPEIRNSAIERITNPYKEKVPVPSEDLVHLMQNDPDPETASKIFSNYHQTPEVHAEAMRQLPTNKKLAGHLADSYDMRNAVGPEQIAALIQHHGNDDEIMSDLTRTHENKLSPQQVQQILANPELSQKTRSNLFDNQHVTQEMLEPFADTRDPDVMNSLVESPLISNHALTKIYNNAKAAHAVAPSAGAGWNEQQAHKMHRKIMDKVLVHPNAPQDIKGNLMSMSEQAQMHAIKYDKNLAPETLQKLAASPSVEVRKLLASRPDLPDPVKVALRGDAKVDVRRAFHQNNQNPSAEDSLAAVNDKASTIREAALDNDRLHPEALAAAAKNKDPDTRAKVAQHKNVTPELAEKLANDPHAEVRLSAHHSGKISPETSTKIWHSLEFPDQKKTFLSKKALNGRNRESPRTISPEVLEAASHDPDLAQNLVHNEGKRLSPEQAERIYSHSPEMGSALLEDAPKLHPEFVNKMFSDAHARLNDPSSRNTRSDERILEMTAQRPELNDENIRLMAQGEQNTDPPNPHGGIIGYSEGKALAKNPRVAELPDVIDKMRNNPNNHDFYKKFLRENPGVTPEHVRDAFKHENHAIRATALSSPQAPEDVMIAGMKDPHENVQRAAKNHIALHLPDQFNETLPGAHQVAVNPAVEKLKHLKGLIQDAGGTVNKRDLKTKFNIQEVPNQILDGKGNITPESIDAFTNSMPKTKYNVSYGMWDSMQRHDNTKPQVVMQMNLTNDQVRHLKDKGLYDTFRKVHDMSYSSGHPVQKHTLGWSRIDTSQPGHAHIDEVQSDLGQGTIRRIIEAKNSGQMKGEEADKYINDLKEINKYLSGGHKTINHAILSAVHQTARERGFPGGKDLNTKDSDGDESSRDSTSAAKIKPNPEIKSTSMDLVNDQAKQSGQKVDKDLPVHMTQTYEELPKQMGYAPANKKATMPESQSQESDLNYRKLTKAVQLANEALRLAKGWASSRPDRPKDATAMMPHPTPPGAKVHIRADTMSHMDYDTSEETAPVQKSEDPYKIKAEPRKPMVPNLKQAETIRNEAQQQHALRGDALKKAIAKVDQPPKGPDMTTVESVEGNAHKLDWKPENVVLNKGEEKPKTKTQWHVKVKGQDGYHPLKQIIPPKKGGVANTYHLHDGRKLHQSEIEDMRPG